MEVRWVKKKSVNVKDQQILWMNKRTRENFIVSSNESERKRSKKNLDKVFLKVGVV